MTGDRLISRPPDPVAVTIFLICLISGSAETVGNQPGWRGVPAMKASVGDRIVIASNRLDRPARDGRVVECRHEDGTPPYVVEWSDSGQTGLLFPGPDAHVQHLGNAIPAQQHSDVLPARHVKTLASEDIAAMEGHPVELET
jgi:hypothetical protein